MKHLISMVITNLVQYAPYCVIVVGVTACGSLLFFRVTSTDTASKDIAKPTIIEVNHMQASDLVRQCLDSVDEEGFGQVIIKGRTVISQQTVSMDQACKIELTDGANLIFDSMSVVARNLYIYGAADVENVKVEIYDSSFTDMTGGLQISLRSNTSNIEVTNSSFDYGLSIGFATGSNDADEAASLLVRGSSFTVTGQGSDGIRLVTTGRASFIANTFQLADTSDYALLLAPRCEAKDNIGANQNCQVQ